MKATPVWISGYAAMGAMVAFFNRHDWLVAMLCATTSAGFLWMARDSGRLRNGENSRSEVECEASQNGPKASPIPGPIAPVQDDDAEWLRQKAHQLRLAGSGPLDTDFSIALTDGLERIANRLEKQSG